MVDAVNKPALCLALRLHEIGDATPYRLSFAGKGKSGASFGFMQGDLAAGPGLVKATFRAVLQEAGVPDGRIAALIAALAVPLIHSPLSGADRTLVDEALRAGSAQVDAMDEQLLQTVYRHLDTCLGTGRAIAPKAQLYIALWANMTGAPTTLLRWLRGESVHLARSVAPAPAVVDGPAMEGYLLATDYFVENPHNFAHMQGCVAAGAALLPGGAARIS